MRSRSERSRASLPRRPACQDVWVTSSALHRARGGSEEAFRELIDPCRRELHLHCYRMLGSPADAEDMLQETLLAAWRGLDDFAGRSSIRTWLYRIATNQCLNALRDSRRRAPTEPVPPFDPPSPSRRSDVTWLQPYPDTLLERAAERAPGPAVRYLANETVELAFIALQELSPRQVAALLLCDVLGYSSAEVAPMLNTTATAVKGTLQRARVSVVRHRTSRGGSHLPADSTQERGLARRFAQAFTGDDIDGVLELLTDDAWLAMPPRRTSTTAPRPSGPSCAAARRGVPAAAFTWSRPAPTLSRLSAATSTTTTGLEQISPGSSSSAFATAGSQASLVSWTRRSRDRPAWHRPLTPERQLYDQQPRNQLLPRSPRVWSETVMPMVGRRTFRAPIVRLARRGAILVAPPRA